MATRKTWIWVLVGAAGVGVVALLAVAGSGIYFVSHHIQAERSTGPDALRAFDTALGSLSGTRPLYELDPSDQPRLTRPLAEWPAGSRRPDTLWMLAWDPEQGRLIHVSLPLWIFRMGHRKMPVVRDGHGFDLERLNLDIDELERIGPALVFDFRNQDGVRVLVWTQ
jgi:hypothetical protein